MVENQWMLCRFFYLDNAHFQPSKIKLVFGLKLNKFQLTLYASFELKEKMKWPHRWSVLYTDKVSTLVVYANARVLV